MFSRSKFLRVVLPIVLAASVLTTGTPSASAVSVGACWSWNMDNKATGTFLTDGTHNGTTASAGTYTLSDFKVDSSIYPTVENGSVSDQTYSFGTQPPYSFIWNGSAPTTFQRQGYTNGFGIKNGVGGSGAYLIFDINFSFISDSYIISVRLNNTQTISLSPTARSNCNTTPVVPSDAPAIVNAVATGTTTATVGFTSPASDGGSTILSYTATSSPDGITATLTQAGSGAILVTGLSPATSYTFTVTATNAIGTSSASAASNSITTLGTGIAPLFSSASSYDGRFTVQIKDYDSAFTYSVTSSAGQVSINSTGLVTVTGLSPDQSVTVSVTTTRTGYASGSGSVTGRSQVAPMLPGTKPTVTLSDTLITCTIGSYSATPTSSAFSLFIDGKHVSTIFSAVGEYLPDWIIPWATSSSITRIATLTSATWTMSDAYKGKEITCATLAYSKNAIGFTASQVMVAR